MKFFHLSDLHLGITVCGASMREEQIDILQKIVALCEEERPDALLISGDIYDKSAPSGAAFHLLDRFLTDLRARSIPVLLISGNHDSADRLSYGADLLRDSGIFLTRPFEQAGVEPPVTLTDSHGPVHFYQLPYVRPATVRAAYPDEAERIGSSYPEAVKVALEHMEVDPEERNVLLAHQFVTGATPSDSKDLVVGGLDAIGGSLFDDFTYVALGHIHGPQKVGRETMRYSGTPLKYSFSEVNQTKSVPVVTLGAPGTEPEIRLLPLTPLRDLRVRKGSYDEIMDRNNYAGTNTDDYVKIILTDEHVIPDCMNKLRSVYPNVLQLQYDNLRTRTSGEVGAAEHVKQKTPLELFEELFEKQNGTRMSDAQRNLVRPLMEGVWKEEP